MHAATAWSSYPEPSPWAGLQNTVTSGYTLIAAVSNELACAVVLVTSGFTNAASLLDTTETLHLRANSASQITSSNAQLLPIRSEWHLAASSQESLSESTNAGAIHELRLLTEFTWDQIARLFSVSRRSVHLWASGGPMSRENEEHLHRVLGIVSRSDRGRTGDNRAALLSPVGQSNRCAFDLLIAGDYESASLLFGSSGDASQRHGSRYVPSPVVLAARAPLPPDVLVAASQDGGPMAPRPARAVRYRKVARDS
jgi:DNA-binding transcriptional regulator YiaG